MNAVMRIIDAMNRAKGAVAFAAHRFRSSAMFHLHAAHVWVWRSRSLSFKEWVIYGGLGAFSLWLTWYLYAYIAYSTATNKLIGSIWLIMGIVMCWMLAGHLARSARKRELERELVLARTKG